MKRPRRQTATDVRLRALKLLAAHPDGCTEAVLAAADIPAGVLIDLVRSGLAIARRERFENDDGAIDVTRVRITEAGELIRVEECRGSLAGEAHLFSPSAAVDDRHLHRSLASRRGLNRVGSTFGPVTTK
jgi:hypothetical protein